MIVSREEAVGLFRKWQADDTPVSVLLIAGGMSVSFAGFILTSAPTDLVIANLTETGEKQAELQVGLAAVETFDYRDIREAKDPIRGRIEGRISSSLMLKSAIAECTIYELVP